MGVINADKTFDILAQSGEIICSISVLPLSARSYQAKIWCRDMREEADLVENAVELAVHGGDFFGKGRLPLPKNEPFPIKQEWHLNGVDNE